MKNKLTSIVHGITHEWQTWSLVIAPTFILLVYSACQNTNIGYLQIHSIDEYVFHGSLIHMYDSLIAHKLSGLFGFGFYQYGFIYFFINLIVAAPGFIWNYSPLSIAAPRIITSLFAVGSLLFVYRFSRLFVEKQPAFLLTLFIVTLPAFWYNATWFHPDWSMTFFILGFVYFLARDNWQFKKYFYLAVIFYGLAIAFKYQAITMIPLLLGYIFYDTIRYLKLGQVFLQLRIFITSLLIIVATFIIANPYILHPLGWQAFSGSFIGNMESNATNHGSVIDVSIIDKINLAISVYYINIIFFFLLNLAALWIIRRYLKTKQQSVFVIIAVNFLINLSYLFLFVNKAWQVYYLPIFATGLLLIIYFIKNLPEPQQNRFLRIAIFIQVITFGNSYYPIITNPRDASSPDYITYDTVTQIEINQYIVGILKPEITKDSVILLSPYTPLTYEDLNIPYENVRLIFGALNKGSFDLEEYLIGQRRYWGDLKSDAELTTSFKPVDFIVLRKDIPFIDTTKLETIRDKDSQKVAHQLVLDLYAGRFDYRLLAETDKVVIFKTTLTK